MKENREETLTAIRRFKAVSAVLEIQRESVQRGKDTSITQSEVVAEIAAVRRARRIARGKGGDPLSSKPSSR